MKIEIPATYEYEISEEMLMDKEEFLEMRRQIINVNKMLSEGIEVHGRKPQFLRRGDIWSQSVQDPTHKALLINIQEIKPKTKEEKALELARDLVGLNNQLFKDRIITDEDRRLLKKVTSEAKAILEDQP